jgi:hypothetical protein
MKKTLFGIAVSLTALSVVHAVGIGDFPGLDELIKKADAIVILRVDRHIDTFRNPSLYTTHDCLIYQTLKGDIPTDKGSRLQLMDTRTSFVTPFALYSSHLMFLTKKRAPNELTDFRTIEYKGANVILPPTGHETKPKGKTVADQIRSVLQRAVDHNKKENEKEQAFLKMMINGTEEARVRWQKGRSYYTLMEIVDAHIDPRQYKASKAEVRHLLGDPEEGYPNAGPDFWVYSSSRHIPYGSYLCIYFDEQETVRKIDWVSE